MAIQVSGTEVISNARELSNIASVDATTVTSLNDAGVGGGFKPVSVSGATQALDVGSYNFFNGGDLSADTTLSFTSVPTDALWTYTVTAGVKEAFTVANSVYSGLSKSVTAEEGNVYGFTMSSDGTKMYTIGINNDTVYQYTLSTAWNMGTATYSGLSKSVNAQDIEPMDVSFNSDGLKMYVLGNYNNRVYQYTLSTAWNVSTATYASISKDFSAQETGAREVFFKPDGTKMYIVGGNQYVYQYTLSTADNVSTATYDSLSKEIGTQEGTPLGLAFSSDGLKMFVVGSNQDKVFQYTLSTAWNVSTATYASISFSVSSQQTTPRGLVFSSDGTKMYVGGNNPVTIFQYSSATPPSITIPAAVENPPATVFNSFNQVSYTFVTNDGGTTVNLINETVL
jgi:hypothetical protein